MRRVERARVVGGVVADLGVGEVVHQVVRQVGDDDADDGERDVEPVDRGPAAMAASSTAMQTRGEGHRQDAGAGHDEPAGHAVDDALLRAGWW